MKTKYYRLLVLFAAAITVSACNGGGTSTSGGSSDNTTTQTAVAAFGPQTEASFSLATPTTINDSWIHYRSGTSEAIMALVTGSRSTPVAYVAVEADGVLTSDVSMGQWTLNRFDTGLTAAGFAAYGASEFVIPLNSTSKIGLINNQGVLAVQDVAVSGRVGFAALPVYLGFFAGEFLLEDVSKNVYTSSDGVNWDLIGVAPVAYTAVAQISVGGEPVYFATDGTSATAGKLYAATSLDALVADPQLIAGVRPTVINSRAAGLFVADTATNKVAFYGDIMIGDTGTVDVGGATLLSYPTGAGFNGTNTTQILLPGAVGNQVYAVNAVGGAGAVGATATSGLLWVGDVPAASPLLAAVDVIGSNLVFANANSAYNTAQVAAVPGFLTEYNLAATVWQPLVSGQNVHTLDIAGNEADGYIALFSNGAMVYRAPRASNWVLLAAPAGSNGFSPIIANNLVHANGFFAVTDGLAVYVLAAAAINTGDDQSTAVINMGARWGVVDFGFISPLTIGAYGGSIYVNAANGVFQQLITGATGVTAATTDWIQLSAGIIAITPGLPPGATAVPENAFAFAGVPYEFVIGSTAINTVQGGMFAQYPGAALPLTYAGAGSNIALVGIGSDGVEFAQVEADARNIYFSPALVGSRAKWFRSTAIFSTSNAQTSILAPVDIRFRANPLIFGVPVRGWGIGLIAPVVGLVAGRAVYSVAECTSQSECSLGANADGELVDATQGIALVQ